MSIVGSFWALLLKTVLQKKTKVFAVYSIPQNASFKLSKSKSLYTFSVFAPSDSDSDSDSESEEEVAKSAKSCTRNQAKAFKAVGQL